MADEKDKVYYFKSMLSELMTSQMFADVTLH